MFDARMRVDSIRLFVSMDTVSRYTLIQEELDIPITEIKNKKIGLRSQLSREVLLCFWRLVLVLIKHVLRCFMPFGHCKTSACFNLKHV